MKHAFDLSSKTARLHRCAAIATRLARKARRACPVAADRQWPGTSSIPSPFNEPSILHQDNRPNQPNSTSTLSELEGAAVGVLSKTPLFPIGYDNTTARAQPSKPKPEAEPEPKAENEPGADSQKAEAPATKSPEATEDDSGSSPEGGINPPFP